jgi:hypothetical protein
MRSIHAAFFIVGITASLIMGQGDGLQDNIPIPSVANTLLPCEPASEGWRLLHRTGSRETFDSNFTQYIGGNYTNTALPTSWTYRSQDSTSYAAGGTPDLRSEFRGDDFDVRMTYRNSGNDAIFYKMLPRGGSAWDVAIEYAIDTNVNAGKQSAGSVFDMWAPTPPASQIYNSYASGKWNHARIVAKGDSVEHWLNNRRVGRYRFWDANWRNAMANSKWNNSTQLAQNTQGCQCMVQNGFLVGFQGDHDGTYHIRDFRIKTTNVRMGAVAPTGQQNPCTNPIGVREKISEKLGYSTERVPGAFRLNLRGAQANHAELLSLDGRALGHITLEKNGESILIRGWKQTGIYFLAISTINGKTVHREKIFLP